METIRQQQIAEGVPRGRLIPDVMNDDMRDKIKLHSTAFRVFICCSVVLLCFVSLSVFGGSDGEQVVVRSGVHLALDDDIRPGGLWHTVAETDNLKLISQRYYGSSSHWRMLQVSNDVARYPQQGTRVWVPATADAWFTQEQTATILLYTEALSSTSQDTDTNASNSAHASINPKSSALIRP